jgi:hypothetical protein
MNPQLLTARLPFNVFQSLGKIWIVLLCAHPSFHRPRHGAFGFAFNVERAARTAQSRFSKTSEGRWRPQLGGKDLYGATSRHVANNPHHLGIKNGDLASCLKTPGQFSVGALRVEVRLANLSH